MKYILSSIAFICLIASPISYAGLIDFVDNGRTTIDKTNSQNWLEWLDLTETRNRSFTDVSNDISDGLLTLTNTNNDLAAGWRYASADEVVGLFNNYFNSPENILIEQYITTGFEPTEIESFISMFGDTFLNRRIEDDGVTSVSESYGGIMGFTSTPDAKWHLDSNINYTPYVKDDQYNYLKANGDLYERDSRDMIVTSDGLDINSDFSATGSWLVRDIDNDTTTQVPEPSTFAIFTLAMLGLAARRLKKR
jgi:hypothetical protein